MNRRLHARPRLPQVTCGGRVAQRRDRRDFALEDRLILLQHRGGCAQRVPELGLRAPRGMPAKFVENRRRLRQVRAFNQDCRPPQSRLQCRGRERVSNLDLLQHGWIRINAASGVVEHSPRRRLMNLRVNLEQFRIAAQCLFDPQPHIRE